MSPLDITNFSKFNFFLEKVLRPVANLVKHSTVKIYDSGVLLTRYKIVYIGRCRKSRG